MGKDFELKLIETATFHPDDSTANAAMEELRNNFDKTYFWCEDCDGLVVKEKECCLHPDFKQSLEK